MAKNPKVSLHLWDKKTNSPAKKATEFTTEEIEDIKDFDVVVGKVKSSKKIFHFCKVTLKDKKSIIVASSKTEVHEAMKDAGGRLRASSGSDSDL